MDPSLKRYFIVCKQLDRCIPFILEDLFRDTTDYDNHESVATVVVGSIYAHLCVPILDCLEHNESVFHQFLYEVGHTIAGQLWSAQISAIPAWRTLGTDAETDLRHCVLCRLRAHMMAAGHDSLGNLSNLSGALSANELSYVNFLREQAREAREGKMEIQFPVNLVGICTQLIKISFPRLADSAVAIATGALEATQKFVAESAKTRFSAFEFYIERLPSQHIGEAGFRLFRHLVLRAAERGMC